MPSLTQKPRVNRASRTPSSEISVHQDLKHGLFAIPLASPSSCLSQVAGSHRHARLRGSHRRDACVPARLRHRWSRDRARAARTRPFPAARSRPLGRSTDRGLQAPRLISLLTEHTSAHSPRLFWPIPTLARIEDQRILHLYAEAAIAAEFQPEGAALKRLHAFDLDRAKEKHNGP